MFYPKQYLPLKIHFLAIKSSRSVLLQPSRAAELHFYSSFQGYPTCYYWSHMARWPDGYKWPFWPSGLPSLKSQTLLNKNHPNELLLKLNILLSPIERRCSTCRWPLLTIGMFPLHLCPPHGPLPQFETCLLKTPILTQALLPMTHQPCVLH